MSPHVELEFCNCCVRGVHQKRATVVCSWKQNCIEREIGVGVKKHYCFVSRPPHVYTSCIFVDSVFFSNFKLSGDEGLPFSPL